LWKIILENKSHPNDLISTFNSFKRIAPLKRLLWNFLFLIPLLAVLVFWNFRSLKKSHQLQIFVSTHLITITLIPLFTEICVALFDIFPKNLLKQFLLFLSSLKIIAFWHYILIFLAITCD